MLPWWCLLFVWMTQCTFHIYIYIYNLKCSYCIFYDMILATTAAGFYHTFYGFFLPQNTCYKSMSVSSDIKTSPAWRNIRYWNQYCISLLFAVHAKVEITSLDVSTVPKYTLTHTSAGTNMQMDTLRHSYTVQTAPSVIYIQLLCLGNLWTLTSLHKYTHSVYFTPLWVFLQHLLWRTGSAPTRQTVSGSLGGEWDGETDKWIEGCQGRGDKRQPPVL